MPRHVIARDGPHPIDVHVGNRVRLCRTLLGMSQKALGEALGLTFQQVRNYERGVNRISASKLWDLVQVLDVPVSFFFDDMPEDQARPIPSDDGHDRDPALKREALELVRAYYRITNASVRKRLYELVKAIATMRED